MSYKCYSDLVKMKSFDDRFNYLKLNGRVGSDTFGFDRYLNQLLYRSPEWRRFRDKIILRDNACDLGVSEHDIKGRRQLIIHHINPITVEQINDRDKIIFDPENVITVSRQTHDAIHYGDESYLRSIRSVERFENDTAPWKSGGQ